MPKEPEKQEITRDEKGRFVEGQSGNPDGRPVFSLVAILKAELQKCPEGQDKKTYAELVVAKMLKEATTRGDHAQIKLIWNYIEGMPKQAVEHSGEVKESIELNDSQFNQLVRETKEELNSGKARKS